MNSVPTLKPGFFGRLKLILDFQRDTLRVFQDLAQHGDIVALEMFGITQYVMFHPDMYHEILVENASSFNKDGQYTSATKGLAYFLGQGLVTSNGDFWRRQRKLAQPAFHSKRIDAYAQTMVDDTLQMLAGWRDGEVRDIDAEMMTVTLNIVAKTLFNTEIAEDARRIGDALTILQHMFSEADLFPAWWPKLKKAQRARALRDLDDVVYRIINERRASGEDQGDLLSMLMLAEDEEGQRMSDKQLRDEAVTLIVAGHETTANALNWTWYLLAQHPEVEARLHAELDAALGGQPPTLADLKRLPYTEMVIKESMRLLPPVYGVSRITTQDVEIGGHRIPKRSVVNVLMYNVQRDPRWWDDPETFMPERWQDETQPRHRYAYLPFGSGPRVCIGNQFAMMEARLLLATIAQRYRLALVSNRPIKPEALITLRPKGGLKMRLIQRERVTTRRQPELAEMMPS